MSFRRNAARAALAAACAVLAAAAAPAVSRADVDPKGCTESLGYNANIPTWEQWFADGHNEDAVLPFADGAARGGGGAPANGTGTPPTGRNLTTVLYDYWDGLVAVTASDAKQADGSWVFPYQVVRKSIGTSVNGRPYNFYVVGTRENLANLDGGQNDAAFWRGVREGTISTDAGLEAAGTRPALAWVTATPHGAESAAGESITRNTYELLARTDCENARRMQVLDLFMMPVRNPDGRDAVTRTTAWSFDANRDFATQNQRENALFIPLMNEYPGVFFIDAHQQGGRGYFFPPNEDPVHHEISAFSLDFIQNIIGPALQNAFNDQSDYYTNYESYDLFTPEYGDTVPSLLMGAAGMTYEKGTANIYSRQVYDHYLAIDTTINVTAFNKFSILSDWVRQWGEAIDQGARCEYQENSIVSPLHDHIEQQPQGKVCGYFFNPNQHTGDTAALLDLLQRTGVRVWRLDTPVAVNGYHEYGKGDVDGATLPAGTLWIPLTQGTKHWINALLEENPWIPYSYYYDVVTWSYALQRGLAGSGFLSKPMSPGIQMTEVHMPSYGSVPDTLSPVYAFNTDSMRGIALAIDLLEKGVNVYRGTTAFTSGGKQFYTGAALVDGQSVVDQGVDLASLAAARNTPVTGLPLYPVARHQLAKPKIGLYTGLDEIPSNPLHRVGPQDGHCGLTRNAGDFCQALFTLAIKDGLSVQTDDHDGVIVPVTRGDLEGGKLVADGFTAFINPSRGIDTEGDEGELSDAAVALRDFINGGGIYIGADENGAEAVYDYASSVDTMDIDGLLTPGSTFDAEFDTTNPVAWGFDLGGWIYRDSTGNAVFDPATIGDGTAVQSYADSVATNPGHYGYQKGAGALAGTPAVVDTPFGSGHAIVFGYDPFFRAWKEQDERLVLNAALYPITDEDAPSPPSPETAKPAPSAAAITPAAPAVPQAKLPSTVSHGTTKARHRRHNADRDVRIRVRRHDARKLRSAVRHAKLSKKLRKKVHYRKNRRTVTLVVRNARSKNEHARRRWVSRIQTGLAKRKVKVLYGLV
jgi:hypothetical protein